ncbi:hypothetical protein GJ496_011914 [Pomphorhynchus laevis]|nr:hypothetical protein GJ496_011914 [Pomphorhynchus laevis]
MCSAIGGSKKVNSSSKMNEKTSDFGKKDDISKIGGVSSNNETAKKKQKSDTNEVSFLADADIGDRETIIDRQNAHVADVVLVPNHLSRLNGYLIEIANMYLFTMRHIHARHSPRLANMIRQFWTAKYSGNEQEIAKMQKAITIRQGVEFYREKIRELNQFKKFSKPWWSVIHRKTFRDW